MWHLLAQASSTATPVEWFQYGVLGGVLVSLIIGWLWPKPPVDRIIEDKERLLEERSKKMDKLIAEVAELRRDVQRLTERVSRDP